MSNDIDPTKYLKNIETMEEALESKTTKACVKTNTAIFLNTLTSTIVNNIEDIEYREALLNIDMIIKTAETLKNLIEYGAVEDPGANRMKSNPGEDRPEFGSAYMNGHPTDPKAKTPPEKPKPPGIRKIPCG